MAIQCPTCGRRNARLRALLSASSIHVRCRGCGRRFRLVATVRDLLALLAGFGVVTSIALWVASAVLPAGGWIAELAHAVRVPSSLARAIVAAVCAAVVGAVAAVSLPIGERADPDAKASPAGRMAVAGVLGLLVALAVIAGAALSLARGEVRLAPVARFEAVAGGTVPGELALQDSRGAATTFAAFRGRVVLVNVWATWCESSVFELRTVAKLAARFAGDDRIAFAALTDGDPVGARRFVAQHRLDVPWFVLDGGLPACLQGGELPRSYVVGRDGAVVLAAIGAHDWDDARVAAFLRDQAGG